MYRNSDISKLDLSTCTGHFHGGRFEGRIHRGRHGWGGHSGRHGFGRRFGRFFEHGDLRTVVLALLEEQPRHGYELIKELEERTGGAYRPSPGVVYPTLALLEDEGMVRQAGGETGRKLYEITADGKAELDRNARASRPSSRGWKRRPAMPAPGRPRIGRAMMNLGMALKNRMSRPITDEELDRIVSMIDDTAAAIEKS